MIQRTLMFFKADMMNLGRWPSVVTELIEAGYNICAAKLVCSDRKHWENHYNKLTPASLKKLVVDIMLNSPVMVFVFEGDEAIANIRERVGSTNPSEANVGTIRRRYGHASKSNLITNGLHCSATAPEADYEINLWFRPEEIFDYRFSYTQYAYHGFDDNRKQWVHKDGSSNGKHRTRARNPQAGG